jgi:hypothetical protein
MKKPITITSESVTFAFRGETYTYPIINGKLSLSEQHVQTMPEGIKVTLTLLGMAKRLSVGDHHYTLREPIWRCLDKDGGLSKKGTNAFGNDDAVTEAAKADKDYKNAVAKISGEGKQPPKADKPRQSDADSQEKQEKAADTMPDNTGKVEVSSREFIEGKSQSVHQEAGKEGPMVVIWVAVAELKENPLNATILDWGARGIANGRWHDS